MKKIKNLVIKIKIIMKIQINFTQIIIIAK